MALTRTVTWKVLQTNETPFTGQVHFLLGPAMVSGGGVTYVRSRHTATLDANGVATATLPRTDDPALGPGAEWVYEVVPELHDSNGNRAHAVGAFTITVTSGTGSLDISPQVPQTFAGGKPTVFIEGRQGLKGDKGDKGDQGAQGLPGTNAVPSDTAVAGYISTTGTSETKTALNAAIDGHTPTAGGNLDAAIEARAVEAVAADPTAADAAAAAVDNAVAGMELVGTELITEDSAEFMGEDGSLLFAVDDLHGTPYLRGSAASEPYTETHLIVAAGQSNSVGVGGPTPDLTNTPLGNLYTVPQKGTQAGTVVRAVEPLEHPWDTTTAGNRGHAFRFGQLYAAANPGVRVVIVPVARAGTGFRSDALISWAPAREAEAGMDSLYRKAINSVNAAAALFTGTVKVAAILWHQGEDDATAGTTGTQYQTDLDALISGFRTEMAGAADAPFIVGQLLHEFLTVRVEPTSADIDSVHQGTPARVTRTAFAANPGAGYGKTDNTHYTGHGQWLLAGNYWDAYQTSLYNV